MRPNLTPSERTYPVKRDIDCTSPEHLYAEVLASTIQHGEQTAIAAMLHIPTQHVFDWRTGGRRNPFDSVRIAIATLRSRGNPSADAPLIELLADLGYVAFRISEMGASDVAKAGTILNEVGDVMKRLGAIDDDRRREPDELRAAAAECREALAAIAAVASSLDGEADAIERQRVARLDWRRA